MSNIVLGTGETAVNNTNEILCSCGAFNGGDSKQDKKVNIYKINKIYTRW